MRAAIMRVLLPTFAIAAASFDVSETYKTVLDAFLDDDEDVVKAWKRVQELGSDFFPVVPSPSYAAGGQAETLTKAERAWLKAAMPAACEATQAVFGLQLHPSYNEAEQFFRMGGSSADRHARFHWGRARGNAFAINESKAALELGVDKATVRLLTTPIPWLPDACTYSNMWPCDMTREEFANITKRFSEDDPIQLTYTKVSRATADDAIRIRSNPLVFEDRIVEFYRPASTAIGEFVGYRVVNMVFDEDMRPHFLALAKALRAPSGGLNEHFRAYLSDAARYLESGEFEELLKADLRQNGKYGRLYFSVFPHEGYWADNLKFPLMLAVGIRDESAIVPTGREFTEMLNNLSRHVQTQCKAAGLQDHQALMLPLKEKDEDGSMIGLWTLKTAGFMRAFKRDPGGHDYPKRDYPGVVDHRNVILFDTVATWSKLVSFMMGRVFGDSLNVTFEGLLRFVFLHEASHGVQIRTNAATLAVDDSGARLKLAEAFGEWWGVLVEPWADAGAVLGCRRAADRGLITEEDWWQCALATIGYQLVRLQPRADILDTPTTAPHLTGTSVLLSRLVVSEALKCDLDSEPVCTIAPGHGSVGRIDSVASALFDELTQIGASGEVAALRRLVNESIEAMPQDLEERILGLRAGAPSYNLLDRDGDLLGIYGDHANSEL